MIVSQIDSRKTHVNYVIAFSDGTLKIGVTSRPSERLAEILRFKAKTSAAQLAQYACTQRSTKDEALKTERNLCSLLTWCGIKGYREWFAPSNSTPAFNFDYFMQTTEMFRLMNAYRGASNHGVSA